MTSRVTLNLKRQGDKEFESCEHQCSIDWSMPSKPAPVLGMHFADNSHLRSHSSYFSTVFSSTPMPSISIDAGPMDDAQYFGDKVLVNEYADVESARHEQISP